jgi:hypothetical protein
VVEGLLEIARAFRQALAGFDAAPVPGEDCIAVVEQLALTEKACAAARARAALRVAECGRHREEGFADAVDWLAYTSGSSWGAARSALETVAGLEHCPASKEAVAAGELSLDQAAVIAATEPECPGSEDELLDLARRSSLTTLREEARRRRLEAIDREELYRRQWQARAVRHWRNREGMVCLRAELPPDTGVRLMNRLDAETDRLVRAARREGKPEARAAHAADALVNLLYGEAEAKPRGTELVLVCDLNAYRRGETRPGEVSHIVGGGPLPVSVVRNLAGDAFLKAVLHDGKAIHTVAHFGRHIPAELRTALELGPLPTLDGARCVDEGCDRRYGLEWDHLDPVANGGRTSYGNLKPRCWPHHQSKTERDREAGRLGMGRGPRSSMPP